MNIIKLFGLCLILLSTCAFGFFKGDSLKKRMVNLRKVCLSFEKLLGFVTCSALETDDMLKRSFEPKIIEGSGNLGFLPEDTQLFNRFLKEFGMDDREREKQRVSLYKSLFEKQLKASEEDYSRLYKLYNSLGFWVGLSVCIILV